MASFHFFYNIFFNSNGTRNLFYNKNQFSIFIPWKQSLLFRYSLLKLLLIHCLLFNFFFWNSFDLCQEFLQFMMLVMRSWIIENPNLSLFEKNSVITGKPQRQSQNSIFHGCCHELRRPSKSMLNWKMDGWIKRIRGYHYIRSKFQNLNFLENFRRILFWFVKWYVKYYKLRRHCLYFEHVHFEFDDSADRKQLYQNYFFKRFEFYSFLFPFHLMYLIRWTFF